MMPRTYKFLNVEKRLADNSIPLTECGCVIWLGHVNNMGYGRLCVNGKMEYVHRAALELNYGEKIPVGLNVLHKCDIPTCINPDHLFLGTHADNVADKVAKNRHPRGETNATAKLTETEVLAIRASLVGVNETARRMGLTPMTISNIRNRKTWKHI
jgi:hypothetical protein